MTDRHYTPLELDTARRVCTPKQLATIDLRRRGWSYRRIAFYFDLDERTVRDRIRRAERRIIHELEAAA